MGRRFEFSSICAVLAVGLLTACGAEGESGGTDAESDAVGDVGGGDAGADTTPEDAGTEETGGDGGGDSGTVDVEEDTIEDVGTDVIDDADPDVPTDPCLACSEFATCDPDAAQPCSCGDGYVGDGETCHAAVVFDALAMRNPREYAGEPIVVDLSVRNATTCTVNADYFGEVATIDASSIEGDSTWTYNDSQALYDAVSEETKSSINVFRVTCAGEGEGNEVTRVVPFVLTAVRPLDITVSDNSLGVEESSELCWNAPPAFESCQISVRDLTSGSDQLTRLSSGLAAEDCFEVTPDATSEYVVRCEEPGTGKRRTGWAVVTVGGGPLVVQPEPMVFLEEGGFSSISWESVDADECSLTVDGEVVSTDLSGEVEVRVRATDWIDSVVPYALECDGAVLRGEMYVPGIDFIELSSSGDGQTYTVGFFQTFVPFCDVSLVRGAETAELPDTVGGGYFEVEFDTAIESASYSIDVTVSCDGVPGAAERTETFTFSSPEVTLFEATPSHVPSSGGEVEVCFDVANVTECYTDSSLPELATSTWSASACVTATVPPTGQPYVYLQCVDDVGGFVEEFLTIGRGATIDRFEVSPSLLAGPGPVAVTLETTYATSCTIMNPDGSTSSGTSQAYAFEMSSDGMFEVMCDDDAGGGSTNAYAEVFIGGGARDFRLSWLSRTTLLAVWRTVPGSTCTFAATNGGVPIEAIVEGDAALIDLDANTADVVATLSCSWGDGSSEEYVDTAGPARIDVEESLTATTLDICYRASNHDYCTVFSPESGLSYYPSQACTSFNLSVPGGYVIECYGGSGEIVSRAEGVVPELDLSAPEISSFTSSVSSLSSLGGSTEICWSSAHAQVCQLDVDSSGSLEVASSGCQAVSIGAGAEGYVSLSCENRVTGEAVSDTLRVPVGARILFFEPVIPVIPTPYEASFRYGVENAVACNVIGPGFNEPVAPVASANVSLPSPYDISYSLVCDDGAGGPLTTAEATIYVGGGLRDLRFFYASATTIGATWRTLPLTTCYARIGLEEASPDSSTPDSFEHAANFWLNPVEVLIVCEREGSVVDYGFTMVGRPQLNVDDYSGPGVLSICWDAPLHEYCQLHSSWEAPRYVPTEDCANASLPDGGFWSIECYAANDALLSDQNGTVEPLP